MNQIKAIVYRFKPTGQYIFMDPENLDQVGDTRYEYHGTTLINLDSVNPLIYPKKENKSE